MNSWTFQTNQKRRKKRVFIIEHLPTHHIQFQQFIIIFKVHQVQSQNERSKSMKISFMDELLNSFSLIIIILIVVI
jgi:hypothetical protein